MTQNFKTYVVIQFVPGIDPQLINWTLNRLTAPKSVGGGELLAFVDYPSPNNVAFIHIGCSTAQLLHKAESMLLKKKYNDGTLREFHVSEIRNFVNGEHPDVFLDPAEILYVIGHEIESLQPSPDDTFVPCYPNVRIKSYHTMLSLLWKCKAISAVFPLHDSELKKIEKRWYLTPKSLFSFKSLPLDALRQYFGDSVAFYFAFTQFYIHALIPAAVIGLVLYVLPMNSFARYMTYCVFNVIWWTVFMERWKRHSIRLAFSWGSLDSHIFEKPRLRFYGEPAINPVTNKLEKAYPGWKRAVKKYAVSYPTILLCCYVSVHIFVEYYRFNHRNSEKWAESKGITAKLGNMWPSTAYSLFVIPVNLMYRRLALFLTNFENHRLQSQYENSFTTKMFIFYCSNSFIGLIYEAFFNRNMSSVSNMLLSFFVANGIFGKLKQTIFPYAEKKYKKHALLERDQRMNQIEKEAKVLIRYEGTYNDYISVFQQFGLISMFSALFPWATVLALLSSALDIRSDAFKFCHVYRRPFPEIADNIGPWQYAFQIVSAFAIATNLALIAIQPSVRTHFNALSDAQYILMFVLIEHVLLAIKFLIILAIPDVPKDIQIARAKALYSEHKLTETISS